MNRQLSTSRTESVRTPDPSLRTVFQPLVELDSMGVVGYEALTRGPRGSALESPAALFAAAEQAGTVRELDWACRETAVETARRVGFRHPLSLFVNAEPSALVGSAAEAEHWRSFRDLRCYTELTERALAQRPAELLAAVEEIRRQDWGIALDDVGVDEASLALMPLVRPDVVKLDRSLLATGAGRRAATVIQSVLDWAAQAGAAVVAEGIETEQQLDLARGYGVTHGQGFLLGRPDELPTSLAHPARPVGLIHHWLPRGRTSAPFSIVNGNQASRAVGTATLRELARQLLVRADSLDPAPALFVCSSPDVLTPELAAVVGDVATHSPLVIVTSGGPLVVPGVPVVRLAESDPARQDVDVIVVSAGFVGLLTARRAEHASADGSPMWDVVLSFDRELASASANALLTRVTGVGAGQS